MDVAGQTGETAAPRGARWPLVVAGVAMLALGLALAAFIVLSQRASDSRQRAAAWQVHTYEVILAAERLQSALFDAQRSIRGYALGRTPIYLAHYQEAVRHIPPASAALRELTNDNPSQHFRLAAVQQVVDKQVARMDETAAYGVQGKWEIIDERSRSTIGEDNVAALRNNIGAIIVEEQRLLGRRRADLAVAQDRALMANTGLSIAGALLLVIAVLAGNAALRSTARARRAATDAEVLARSRDALEAAVASRTREIAAANAALEAEIERSRAAEAQVRQMQKLESIGQLTGGIAHDFNNMLAIVIGSLDLALRRLDDPGGRVAKYVENAMDGAKRASSLTARLLAFSRQQALAPEPIDANVFVTNISELLRRTLGEGVQIETVLAGGLWRAYADAGELENAVVNLAVNARDAMEGAGKLTIETANTHLDDTYAADNVDVTAGQYVVVCVTDTGGGMPRDVIDRAFDPFFTTKGVGKGTGLGLSQVFGFVKQSGGHVKIYSEEGSGTTVKLYLPRWTGADAPERLAPSAEEMPRARAGEVVLVVEDEERVRLITVDTLRELGYGVIHAADGMRALEVVDGTARIDLLFTDIVMPGMTGRELADTATARRDGLRVLYTTGYTRNAVVHNGMLDANVAFLAKPFTVAALATKVRQVLDGGGINRTV